MKGERDDSAKDSKARAGAGRKRTVPPREQSRGAAPRGGRKTGDTQGAKKKTAPASRAAKPKAPPAKPRASKAAVPARPAPAKARKPAARAEKPAAKAEKPAAKAPKAAKAAKPVKPEAPAKAAAPRAPRAAPKAPPAAPSSRKAEADFTDEERVESAKYETGERAPRVFEEERFIFPETYGHNRLRLLVKDPQWLFAHWDVDPGVLSGLRSEMGERAAALSRLTLRVEDPEHGGGAVIHLPEDARSWYVRADRVRRAYRAELGLTLPSGEYRRLATSNTVRTPPGSTSPRRASRRARYEGPRRPMSTSPGGDFTRAEPVVPASAGAAAETSRRAAAGPGPWRPKLVETRPGYGPDEAQGDRPEKGGASDLHRR